jgi:hypothetical protein
LTKGPLLELFRLSYGFEIWVKVLFVLPILDSVYSAGPQLSVSLLRLLGSFLLVSSLEFVLEVNLGLKGNVGIGLKLLTELSLFEVSPALLGSH